MTPRKLFPVNFIIAICVLIIGLPVMGKTLDERVAEFESGLRPAVFMRGTELARWTIEERMVHYKVPGMSLAIIENGEIIYAKGYGVKAVNAPDKVDKNTVFSVASISKIATAATILRLVAKGQISLEGSVNDYLKTWQVSENIYTQTFPVTLRGIMAHTAGLTLHGFPDFDPGEQLPTVINTLDGTPPSLTEPVKASYVPGTAWRYSGGGTTVAQLLIEDVTGLTFPDASKRNVFDVLGMSRSTFQNPLPAAYGNIAKAHNEYGQVTALPRGWQSFPEMAASGLWTTPSDIARMMIGFMRSYHGLEGSFLPKEIAQDMMTEVGVSPFGLGPVLDGAGIQRRFSHGGTNDSYTAWMEGHLASNSGVVIFTNAVAGYNLYLEVRRAISDAFEWPFYRQIFLPRWKPAEETFKEFAGDYQFPESPPNATERFFFRELSPEDNLKFILKDGGLWLGENILKPMGPNHFILRDRFKTINFYTISSEISRVEFVKGIDGNISGVIFQSGGSQIAFRKIRKRMN